MSGDIPAAPSLTDRMTIVAAELRAARDRGDVDTELWLSQRLDRLIDRYIAEQTPP